MVFTNEYDYLLHLIQSALHSTVPENIPDSLSFEKVLEYGIIHEVANIAFPAVEKLSKVPDEVVFGRWRGEYWKAVKRDIAQKNAREEVLAALHSHGIYTLEVQGTVVKKYYPQAHLRMMSDIDFIIPAEKLDEAGGIMQGLGYKTKSPDDTEIDAFRGNIVVELHTEFFDKPSFTREALTDPYSHAVCGENYTATVSDTVFYLYHLLHTIKHCGNMGSGIRRIIDLYYLENALGGKVDYDYIDSVLKKHGFYEIKQQLLSVKDHWFNGKEPETDISEFEKEILESGNHGKEENFYRHKFARDKEEGKHFIKLRFILRFFFPSKEEIYHAHPFCKKHRYPIVLCWLHRGLMILNPKRWAKILQVLSKSRIKAKKPSYEKNV